ncbi:MAG TPA: TIGR03767 family metallophosphoesterase [Streptosporangiaceae bacterium]
MTGPGDQAAAAASTAARRFVPGEPGEGGYRLLTAADGEQHTARTDLHGGSLPAGWQRSAAVLLTLAHLSDTHVMDHQSPGRAELIDRYSDPDSPLRETIGIIGTYRPQELFTFQVAEAMACAVRQAAAGPVGGGPVDLAVVTGDSTDNCQGNELRGSIGLLDGGLVRPDSGDPLRYEGVCAPEVEDERYWHPDGGTEDLPTGRYGLPKVPGVLAAVRRPFQASGLGVPWYAVHGNHDNMLQGTVQPAGWLSELPVGAVKVVTPPPGVDAAQLVARFGVADGAALADLATGTRLQVTPDPGRATVTRAGHVRAHFTSTGSPRGHGYSERNLADGTAYYAFDHGVLRCVVLDTVNPSGGWQGSIDSGQLGWLEAELTASASRPVILFSHHTLETMVNDLRKPDADRRVLGPELREVLLAHPCVVAWLNGHTHRHAVTAVTDGGGQRGFWQITTASHLDWPQQARIVEFLAAPGALVMCCTVIDSAAGASYQGSADPADLAALAREVAANDWQVREQITADGGAGAGTAADRNVILPVDWPRTSAQARLGGGALRLL